MSIFGVDAILSHQTVEPFIADFIQLNHTDGRCERMTVSNMIFQIWCVNLFRAMFARYKMGCFMLFNSILDHFSWAILAFDHVFPFDVRINCGSRHKIWTVRASMHLIKVSWIISFLYSRITMVTFKNHTAVIRIIAVALDVVLFRGRVITHFDDQ